MSTFAAGSEAPAIRACIAADAAAIAEIYNYYVRETVITFEETPVSADEMARRIADIGARYPWLVAERDGAVVGWAYAAEWKTRSAYRFSVETAVYIAPTHRGRAIGTALYVPLIAELEARELHSVVGGIALPNPASVALHEKLGFTKIAHFGEVGRKFDRWVDVGYWQLILENKSVPEK
jgi:L-amino acid N-acyltransferase YncA